MIQQHITETLRVNYMPYSAYVILYRALPEIDGFKPSQRRILYTMMKMGLLNGGRKKSQGVVGSTMFLHPHGDLSIYDTLVRMSKDNEALLHPYIDSKGNFGHVYSKDTQPASARYTEVKLAEIAKELFKDINKNTVDMADNYDGTMQEPKLLPVTFPSILTNPSSGIANGMSSSIASFNLNEVIDFTIAYIQNKNAKVEDYITAPDFPTGANIIYNEKEFKKIFDTGKGSFKIRATNKIEDNYIIFEELPYTTNFEAIMARIADLVKEEKLKGILEIDDIYGLDSKGIQITVKKNVNKEELIEKLYQMTPLESSFSCNQNIVVNGFPKVLGFKEIIHEWVLFRVNAIKRGLQFDADKKAHKKRMLEALKQVLLDVDKAVSIIRNTPTNKEVVANLQQAFGIDEEQAEFVAEIKLRHLNKEYLINRVDEIATLEEEIKDLTDLIGSKVRLAKLIISQLQEVKAKHGQERKSQVIQPSTISVSTEPEIEDYNVKVFVTREGYLKKITLTSLRSANEIKVKDGDEIVGEFETTNNSDILVFTNKQNVYKYKSYELENHKPSVLGEYLPSLLGLDDEEIEFVTVTNDYKGHLLVGFEDGKLAKIELSAYYTKQNRKKLANAYANKKAIYWNVVNEGENVEVLAISSIDKALIFNTDKVNPKSSKTTLGVAVMKSKNDSYVKSYFTIDKDYSEADYYRTAGAGIGKYLRDGDFSELIIDKQ